MNGMIPYDSYQTFLALAAVFQVQPHCLLGTFEGVSVTVTVNVTVTPSPDLFCRHLDDIVFSTKHHPILHP